jgi:hypothetical protein
MRPLDQHHVAEIRSLHGCMERLICTRYVAFPKCKFQSHAVAYRLDFAHTMILRLVNETKRMKEVNVRQYQNKRPDDLFLEVQVSTWTLSVR